MQPIKVTTLSACIAAIGFVPTVYAADNSTVILDTITVKGTRNKDEIGKTEFMPAKSSIFTRARKRSKPSKATPYPTF